jgi:flagellar M-ring protein FliF
MNAAPKALDSLREAFSAMPLAARLIVVMLSATIAIGLGLLVKGNSTSETEHLFGGRSLSESEVDSVEMAFSHAGLSQWVRQGRRIGVPSGTRSEYLAALRESASLPLTLRSSVQAAIEQASPFESSDQRLAREMHAKAQDLAATIMAFPDVRWGSVVYDRGERSGLSRARPQSASVFVSPEGGQPLSKVRVAMIQKMVRAAYAGMSGEEVVVTDANASYVSGHGDDEDPMLRRRREEETAYEQKVRSALVGYGPIRVAAHVELDPTMGVQKATLKYDSGGPVSSYSIANAKPTRAPALPHSAGDDTASQTAGNRPSSLADVQRRSPGA